MKELLLSLSAFLLAFAASVQAFADDQYIRISNVSMLHDGDEVIIVSAKYGVAMSKFQTNKYVEPCRIAIAADSLTASALNDSVAVFTLNKSSDKWRLYNEDKGWLYAPNTSNSDLTFTSDKSPKKGSSVLATLTFDDYANVLVSFSVSGYEYLKYRHQTLRFARYQYADSNDHIQLYRRLKNPKIIERLPISESGDGTEFDADDDIFARSVVVDRTFTADGGYYTLCLPFDITETDARTVLGGAQLKCLKSVEKPNADKLIMHFLSVRSVEAGVPCLLKLPLGSADIVNPEFFDKFLIATKPSIVTTKQSGTTINFIGTYTPMILPADGRYRFLSADGSRLVTPNADGELKGLRAYFHFSEPVANSDFDSAGILKNISIAVDGEEIHSSDATAICDVRLQDGGVGQQDLSCGVCGADKAIGAIFTLAGVRIHSSVKDLKPGIYITSNGRKVVVK